ncbi:MAG TPA: TPM domain-containing protein, partial [Casimicrobiaceae bacterium]|nr:TPM domain-containing protein [Casimicrobiaceae bacterium]
MTVAAVAIRVALLLLALVAAAPAVAADVPFMSGRIVDNAELLPRATREKIGATLAAHESATGNEIAVLTVPTLDGESIEGSATRVFDAWKLGKKGNDNGVLLIVVPQDRRLRIEVGYGLEGTLPDVVASRIIRDVMTPAFKGGDYDRGIGDGVAAIVATLEGRSAATAPAGPAPSRSSSRSIDDFEQGLPPWPMRILLGAFIFGVIGLFTFIGVMTPGV